MWKIEWKKNWSERQAARKWANVIRCRKNSGRILKKKKKKESFPERTRHNEIGFEFCIEFYAECDVNEREKKSCADKALRISIGLAVCNTLIRLAEAMIKSGCIWMMAMVQLFEVQPAFFSLLLLLFFLLSQLPRLHSEFCPPHSCGTVSDRAIDQW